MIFAKNQNHNMDVNQIPEKLINDSSQQQLQQQNGYVMIRKYLINSAVNFLQNSRLKLSTNDKKREFLIEKGLTNDEIDFAFELAIRKPLNDHIIQKELDELSNLNETAKYSRPLFILYQFLIWSGFLYGAYTIYWQKIHPYLFKNKRHITTEEKIYENIEELKKQINELSSNLSIVHEFITTYCRLRDDSTMKIKSELSSIKALLVNRHQFPSVPNIPKWQLSSSSITNNDNTNSE